MTIKIDTRHTVTCENAPAEDVLKEMQEKCPDVTGRPDLELKNGRLKRDNDFAMRRIGELQDTVAARNRELDKLKHANQQLKDSFDNRSREAIELVAQVGELKSENISLAEEASALNLERVNAELGLCAADAKVRELKAENEQLKASSRPALPEGMRIAESPEFGRVVVSPGTNINGYYMFFTSVDSTDSKAAYWYAKPSALTFLDEEPAPAPLPKPEDCKPGEAYLVKVDIGGASEFIAERSVVDSNFPWEVPALDDKYKDAGVTLLARMVPDRDYKEQA